MAQGAWQGSDEHKMIRLTSELGEHQHQIATIRERLSTAGTR